mmetsp:Transcript_5055/g.6868  ORF Transcript_5055/g.6868 Transcript_5055/m.6868 type:complete len:189 (-) Transcript_5055:103-669(-)|eukprot:CAMPEP_0196586514 /NCGR_PEP_ID=MMETSP1081-20130531/54564_1 /TAXON_ID=36882 /ORGANISM="Pyramimonas amylifera, Strain CCMP720" /LENGTH=188 /DNA_ID=CAMNT_0041908425 /DNA_START=31 /DNA_END=597 /DNA_ORIENTATION=-
MVEAAMNPFLANPKHTEKEDLNQYWYSAHTIEVICLELEETSTRVAFLSTPSLFFSLKNKELKKNSAVFDLDEQWANLSNFVRYDFKEPLNVPANLHHTFDCVVIDPPFITREVWEKYAETARLLLTPEGKIICSTIQENAPMMKEVLDVNPTIFFPSIPHLVYQYCLYSNYESARLSAKNPEIPDDD